MKPLLLLDKLKAQVWLQIFTIYLRYLIGGAFIIAAIGMGKLSGNSNLVQAMGQPIQNLQPLQQFFRVMAESGLYWQFIGWSQIVAGVLLMTHKFAKLGALIFFGMILNIFVITVSYHFRGTPFVTGLMLLATIYLIVWDLRSFMFLFTDDVPSVPKRTLIIDHSYWKWVGAVMVVSIVASMSLMHINFIFHLLIPFTEGLMAFIIFLVFYKRTFATFTVQRS